ncbi:GNAT family N-acetyltransferase [Enterobacteriaceae bacterium RIT691]|nr:GNAT family N-acetyltransferase [Enterobacteriaceae bacterium RIT691]
MPILNTSRLVLTALTGQDWPDFLSLHSDVQVRRYMGNVQSEAQILEKFESRLAGSFYSIRRLEGEFVGDIGLTLSALYPQQADIGYALLPKAWGKGYALEALLAVCQHGFSNEGLQTINAWVLAENSGSVRVLEKAGFRRTQVLENAFELNGKRYDDWVYSLDK